MLNLMEPLEDIFKQLHHQAGLLLESINTLEQGILEVITQFHKHIDERDAHLHSAFGIQNRGEHQNAVFSKGVGPRI
jgi:hypothetical protein